MRLQLWQWQTRFVPFPVRLMPNASPLCTLPSWGGRQQCAVLESGCVAHDHSLSRGVVSSTGVALSVAQASWLRTRPHANPKRGMPWTLGRTRGHRGSSCEATLRRHGSAQQRCVEPMAKGRHAQAFSRARRWFVRQNASMHGLLHSEAPLPPHSATCRHEESRSSAQLTARGRFSSSPSTKLRGWQTWSDSSLSTDTP